MNLRKNIVFGSFFESFKAIRKTYIFIPITIDLLFILSYGFLVDFFISNIKEKAVALIETGKSLLYSGGLIKGLMSNNETLAIILNVLGLMVVMYVQYCIFQGLAWRFSKKFVNEKVHYFTYIKKFFLINILWFVFFFVIEIADYARRLLIYLRGLDFTTNFFSILLLFLLFVVIYFAFISYALISKYKVMQSIKRCFSLGIKKIKLFLLVHLIIFVVFLIINYLLSLVYKINFTLMIILGLILVSPSFTWARVFLNLVVGKVDKRG